MLYYTNTIKFKRMITSLIVATFLSLTSVWALAQNNSNSLSQITQEAERGNAEAQFELAKAYYQGEGVQRSNEIGDQWLLKSAQNGYALSQYALAKFIHNDEYSGPVSNKSKEVLYWLGLAEKQQEPNAIQMLGNLYFVGDDAIKKDQKLANNYYRAAANLGLATAQYNLGASYLFGTGIEKDMAKAREWFEKAAQQNDERAQYNFGLMLFKGDGGPVDRLTGVEWIVKAANQGHQGAKQFLNELAGERK